MTIGAGIAISGQERPSHPVPIVVYLYGLNAASFAINSGTYVSGTGLVTLTLGSSAPFGPGDAVLVGSATGTGSFASINGLHVCGIGTTGVTVTYTIATGLTMTITGGSVVREPGPAATIGATIEIGSLISPQHYCELYASPQTIAFSAGFSSARHADVLAKDGPGTAFTTPGVQGPNVRPPVHDVILTAQEPPWHPGAYLKPGKQGPDVRVPGADRLVTTQEPPPEVPLRGSLALAGIQGPNVAPPVVSRVLTVLEQPWHASSQWWIGIQGPNVASTVTTSARTTQEQPWHPAPLLLTTERPVSSVQPSISDSLANVQEQPWHPGSFANSAIAVVVAPPQTLAFGTQFASAGHRDALARDNAGQSYTISGAQTSPVVRPAAGWTTSQETPWHPVPSAYILTTERPVTPVQPSISDSVLTVQEQPWHPSATITFAGVPGPNVSSGACGIFTGEEDPYHPAPFIAPRFIPFVASTILTPENRQREAVQEQPWHPGSLLVASKQGPNVAPPQAQWITVQEQPWHPASYLLTIERPVTTVQPSISDSLLTTQEQPSHPSAAFIRGTAPPVSPVAPSIQDCLPAVSPQEQPWHPSAFVPSPIRYVASIILTPEYRQWTTAQQQPDHPGPSFGASKQGPNVAPPVPEVITRQEQPDQPATAFERPGVQGPNVAPPPARWTTAQEQPWHPASFVNYAIARDAPGVRALLSKVEEITGHPQPFLRSSIIVVLAPVAPTPHAAITSQETPWHPSSLFGERLPAVGSQSPERRQWTTLQEPPWHPGSITLAGRSFTGKHTPERRSFIVVQEQPRESPSELLPGTFSTTVGFFNHPHLIGSGTSAALLLGSEVPTSLTGEIDTTGPAASGGSAPTVLSDESGSVLITE